MKKRAFTEDEMMELDMAEGQDQVVDPVSKLAGEVAWQYFYRLPAGWEFPDVLNSVSGVLGQGHADPSLINDDRFLEAVFMNTARMMHTA